MDPDHRRQAICFNNAGVLILQLALHQHGSATVAHNEMLMAIAMDLFRGALEARLVYEQSHHHHQIFVGDQDSPFPRHYEFPSATTTTSSLVIRRAMMHILNLHSYLLPTQQQTSPKPFSNESFSGTDADGYVIARETNNNHTLLPPSQNPFTTATTSSPATAERVMYQESDVMITVPPECRGYEPFLCTSPFPIPEEEEEGHVPSTLISGIIVYNLALVHQRMNRTLPKTADLYTIAAAVLTSAATQEIAQGGPTPLTSSLSLLLRVSLLNNFGIWCYDNGDGETMQTCMERLLIALKQDDVMSSMLLQPQQGMSHSSPDRAAGLWMDPTTLEGVRNNVQWLLAPLHGCSPAA